MSASPLLPLARRFWVALPTAGLIALAGCQTTPNAGASAAPAAPTTTSAPVPAAAPIAPVTAVEGISEYVLPNGLRVLLAPDSSKPTTTVNMTYQVGSRHENYGETGMAHLLEHMLFKGTPTHRNALAEFARRGLRANGSTWTDRTNYFASFSANADNLDWYLRWQADAMVNSLIQRSDLDSEMTVVRNEMESGENSPFRVLMEKMFASSFQWHNYGKTTIGARADVENVDTDRLRAFYHQYYQPDNAVLIVSGAFDVKSTLATIEDAFKAIPKPTRKLPHLYTIDPVQDGERSVTLRRSGGAPVLATMYHVPAAGSPDYTAIDLAAIVLGDTPSGRLHKALVDSQLAAGTFGYTFDMHDPGVVMFGAQLPPGADRDKATAVLLKTIESLKTQPITSEELERARIKWLQSWELTYANAEKLGVALSESIAAGDWRLFFLSRDRVRDAKLEDVQRVAQSYLVESNRTLGSYVPTAQPLRSPAPQTVDVAPMVQDYRGNPNFVEAEAFDPSPANLDARTTRKTIALPGNGQLQLAMLPKPTRGGRVSAQLLMQFGNVDSLRGKRDISDAAADLITRGTPTMTRQQIDDRLDKLNAQVGISGGGTNVSASISTTRENLAPTVALVVELLRTANFPADQLEEYRRSALTSIEQSLQQPDAIASRALARHGNPYPADDLRYTPSFQEDLQAARGLKRDDIVRFHQQFYGAGMLRMSAVGDFDPAVLESTLTKSLAGWKVAPAYTRVPSPFVAVTPTKLEQETPDKANAFYIARLPVALQDNSADYPALMLANFMFGLSEHSRLWNRVREKDGLSYNIRSVLRASSYESSGSWQVYAIYAPQNRVKLDAAIREEIERLKTEGFTEQEVKDGIEALINYRRLSRAQDGAVAGGWIDMLEVGRTFAFTGETDRKLQALTAADVNAVFKRYFDTANFTSSYAGDFAGAAKKQ